MSVLLPTFRRVRLTQQCVIHPQDKGGNYLPCASEDWVLFVSLAADGEKVILRTEHRCLPIKPGGALLLPPNVCHELPFVQAPCLMLEFSAADDGQAMFERRICSRAGVQLHRRSGVLLYHAACGDAGA